MNSIFNAVNTALKADESVVLLTVISTKGSAPRGSGARMIVYQDGRCEGTIGGGSVEFVSAQQSKELFHSKKNCIRSFGLAQEGNVGMVCGGDVGVLFQYIESTDENKKLYQTLCQAIKERKNTWLATSLCEPMETKVYTEETVSPSFRVEIPTIVEMDEARYYVEMISNTTTVYVFGGGHVGQEVVPVLSHLGFYTVVIDSREGLANPTYFPTADQIHCFPYAELEERLDITPKDYVILMTNTHKNDLDVLQRVLKKKPFYLGVMGSRAKVKFITEKLKEQGYTQADIDHCHMPIGLDISAETPAEIAISIAGELIHHRSIRTRNQ